MDKLSIFLDFLVQDLIGAERFAHAELKLLNWIALPSPDFWRNFARTIKRPPWKWPVLSTTWTSDRNDPTTGATEWNAIGVLNLNGFTMATKSNWTVYSVRKTQIAQIAQENRTVDQGPSKKPVSMIKTLLKKR